MRKFLIAVFLLLGLGFHAAMAQSNWQVLKTFHVGGEGGWDYVTVDAPNHRLFVTRSTHTIAVDETTGKVLGDIPGQNRSHGVALVPKLGRGFITDGGGSGAIIIFDMKTYAVLGRIETVPDSDGIIYDAKLDRVLAVSGDSGVLMTFRPDIDPKNGKIDAPIALGGAPEFLASDGTGRIYVNLEDKDVVAVVDLQSRKVIARWPVAPGGRPVGMAIDPATHRLFVGCRKPQKLVVMSTESGKVEETLPIGEGVDATGFHAGHAFASSADGTFAVAAQKGGTWVIEQTVTTPKGARTMGLDHTSGRIFLPTAELEASGAGRPKPKPGTFEIVEVGQQ